MTQMICYDQLQIHIWVLILTSDFLSFLLTDLSSQFISITFNIKLLLKVLLSDEELMHVLCNLYKLLCSQFEVYAFKQLGPIGLESIASLYIKGPLLTPNVYVSALI